MSYEMIYVPEDILDRLNSRLKKTPEMMLAVLRKTINSTAKRGRKIVVRRSAERYTLENASERIKNASEYESARGKRFNATILIKGTPEPLIHFEVTSNEGEVSAKAKVLQTSQMKDLTIVDGGKKLKAFVQTIKNIDKQGRESYHVGVFRRMTEEEKKNSKSKIRSPIKQLYSPSIPQMVKNDEVYPLIEKDIKEEMYKTLEKHIAAVMEGMK